MLTTLAKTIANINGTGDSKDDQQIIKTDPISGFSEFPAPGDVKKHLLPIFIDPEAEAAVKPKQGEQKDTDDSEKKDFWMPDKFCKVCYGCEDAFTMYRRRHHCRMCGQVFCNPCSSFYIDGALINLLGPVRSCRLCHDQLFERSMRENKFMRRQADNNEIIDQGRYASYDISNALLDIKPGALYEPSANKLENINTLQKRWVNIFIL